MPSSSGGGQSGADLASVRLDLAGTRSFAAAGAGQARRERLSAYLDHWVEDIWVDACDGAEIEGLALVAVGSVARRDCGPLSDVDLVLLHDPRVLPQKELDALAERVWYPIWDAKVGLDHSVRTMAQCRQVAGSDLSAAVGLLDLRHLAGDRQLVNATRSTVAHDWRANARTRLSQLVESVSARHQRHGELAHLVEPDLKEARGGLRDMSVLRALTEAWLADRPHGAVDTAYQRLLDVRDAIHVVTGRGRDRLSLPDHDAVAALLGYSDADLLLTDVSHHAREVTFAVDATLRRAGQSQRARTLRVGPRRPVLRSLGYGLYLHDGEVVLGPRADPGSDPLLVLRAALVAAKEGLPLAPATLANLAGHSAPLSTPWPDDALGLFTDLLASGAGLVPVWEALDLAGIIERWIPQWTAVRSRPQRNAVHRHTVDRHLVEAVVAASGFVREADRPDLLLLAALLHDIGKVPGSSDHSHVGAAIAEDVLTRLGVEGSDREMVVRLVREHLTLIDLATRRDPADPNTLAAVAEATGGSRAVLDMLAMLTEADAVATGPLAWTDWRATLFQRLVRQARDHLATSHSLTPAVPAAATPLAEATIAAAERGEVTVTVTSYGSMHRLDIVAADRLGLFADTAGLLAAHGLVVRSAVLRTVDGVALDEWHVESPDGDVPGRHDIERGLARLATGDRTPLARLTRRASREGDSRGRGAGPGQVRALVASGASDSATVVEVRAGDRPGLLYDVGRALTNAGLDVRSAHIATYAGQALDSFYLTTDGGRMLSPAEAARAVAAIIDGCG
jgi:[protein-PII] uridylyltransferase